MERIRKAITDLLDAFVTGLADWTAWRLSAGLTATVAAIGILTEQMDAYNIVYNAIIAIAVSAGHVGFAKLAERLSWHVSQN